MPRLNGNGPQGMGPQTGRGMGPCGGGTGFQGGYSGCGRGFRRGMGFGRMSMPMSMTNKDESEMLEDEAGIIENQLKSIKQRLTELGKKK